MKHKNRYIFSGLFFLLSLIVIFSINQLFKIERREVIASHKNELKAIAMLKIDQLSQWYTDELYDSKVISENIYLIERIKKWLLGNDENDRNGLQGRIRGLKNEHGYHYICIFTSDFKHNISTDDSSKGIDATPENIMPLLSQTDKVISSGFYKSDKGDEIYIDFYSPVFDREKKKIAYILFRHAASQDLFPLIQSWPVPSRSSETLIIRKESDHVLFLNNLRHVENAALNLEIPLTRTDVPAIYAALGNSGFIEGNDYRGINVLAYADSIPGTRWFLIAKTDINEIYENTLFNRKNQAIITFILLIVLFGFVALFYNLNQKNFYKKLFEAQEEFKTTLYSIGDGVITTNSAGKIVHMNPVAEYLTGWKEKKAIGKDIDVVFVIVNEDTFQVVDNPVAKVIKEGKIVSLANHSLLLATDGRKIPVADSGAPIFDEAGRVSGVVLVFRDQTKERENRNNLLESQRKMSTLLSNLPGMAYRCRNDKHWTMEFVSDGCLSLTDYSPEEVVGNKVISFYEITHSEDREMVMAEVQRALAAKRSYTVEYRIITKKGRIKWVWEKGQGVYESEGKIIALEGLISDITERKLFEVALKVSENQFQTLTHYATVGIFRTDSNGRTTYVNPMWCKLSGISSIEAQDFKWTMAIHPDDRDFVLNEWDEAVKNRLPSGIEYRFIKTDGKIVWVSGNAVPEFNAEGELSGYIGTITDITPQKEAFQLLKESEEKYRLIIQNQNELIAKVDVENRFQFVSQSYCKLFSKTEEELIGNSFIPQIHEDDREKTKNEMKKLFSPPYSCYLEQREFTSKGWRWLSWSDTAVLDEDNNVVSIIGVGHDIHEKKIAEEKVKSLSLIVEETQDEIYVFDRKTFKFIYLNNSALKNLGYSFDEIVHITPLEIKPEFTSKDFKTLINPLLKGEKPNISFETIHERKNGTQYPVEVHYQVIEYEGVKAFCAFVRDITNRKETTELLTKSNILLRTIIDNLPDAIYMKDTEARKVLANRADIENCGRETEEQILGKDDFELFPRELAQHFWDDDQKVLKEGIPVINREEKLQNKFGQTKILLSSKVPLKDTNGKIIGLVGVGRDVTREKEAEAESRKLARAVSQSPVSIIITDPEGIIEYVNPKFSEVSGYPFEEAIGKNPRIVKSGHHNEKFYHEMWETLKKGKDWQGEILNRKKNGELFWESAIISPIISDKGEILYFVGIKEDISEKKKMMEELMKAKERAEESDQLKSSFLANMSHEIRTPLNSILGFSNFIASEENLSKEERNEFTGIINKSADSLLQIINDIIDISSLETGQLQIFPVIIEVSSILKSLHTVFSRKKLEVGKPDIKIEVNNIGGIKLFVDENRLIQIFTNLLNNSLKFTKQGTIAFGIESHDDNFVTLFVSDTGIGIKKEYHHSVFERFRQGDNIKNREYGGNGLGLSIVKNLVELMSGKIWLESEPGKGTIFRFALPVR